MQRHNSARSPVPDSVVRIHSVARTALPPTRFAESNAATDPLVQLTLLDFETDGRSRACADAYTYALQSPQASTKAREAERDLNEQLEWFQEARRTVEAVGMNSTDPATIALRDAMSTRLQAQVVTTIDMRNRIAKKGTPTNGGIRVIDTSEYSSNPSPYGTETGAGRFFDHPLKRRHPLILVSSFLALALYLLGGVTRHMCNFTLNVLKTFTEIALQRDGQLRPEDQEIINSLPTDTRTARRLFDVDPVVTEWATCPSCSMTYEPTFAPDAPVIPIYPRRCTHQRWRSSQPCNSRLTKNGVIRGESVRIPIRPFPVQDFDIFVGRLLSQPGIETTIRTSLGLVADGVLRDIAEGDGVKELYTQWKAKTPAPAPEDLLLLWSLSVDWFNPYHNKISGKSVSSGSIAMMCLLLPPSLRIKPDYIFLGGIIPHPEPAQDDINHFLRPIIDRMAAAWEPGVWYRRTHQHPRGRRVHSGIAVNCNDLPASRKVSGQASHAADCFCSLCHLKRRDINNICTETWVPKKREELFEHAKAWRDAPNKATRKRIYKNHGVRWSELWRLPYWDPVKFVVIDAMHAGFLRVVQHHGRSILGMDIPVEGQGDEDIPVGGLDDVSVMKGLARLKVALTGACTAKRLERFKKVVLWEACRTHGLDVSRMSFKKAKKRALAHALLVSTCIA